jgi:hypothetical protein
MGKAKTKEQPEVVYAAADLVAEDDLEGVIPEPDSDPDPLPDLATLQQRDAWLETEIKDLVATCHEHRKEIATCQFDERTKHLSQARECETSAVQYTHSRVHLGRLIALRRVLDKEAICDELAAKLESLRSEKSKAIKQRDAASGRERGVAESRLELIDAEIQGVQQQLDSEARRIPWRCRHRLVVAIRDRERVLRGIEARKNPHTKILSSLGMRSMHSDSREALRHIEAELIEEQSRIESLRAQLDHEPVRPDSRNPNSWPEGVHSSVNGQGTLGRLRDALERGVAL